MAINTLEAIFTRSSIRSYTNEAVSSEMIHHLLDAAMAAPSAGNQQPWHFVVVTNNDVKAKLATVSPYATPADKAPVVFALCNKKSGNRFEGCVPQDMSAAAENLLLAVTANNLGAVWMGIAPEEDRMEKVTAVLSEAGIDMSDLEPFCLIAVGHPQKPITERPSRYKEDRVAFVK